MSNVLDCSLKVSEFKLKSLFIFTFGLLCLGKV